MIYRKCSELPLSVFIKIVLEDNVGYLVKDGSHSQGELQKAWEDIYSEYFELAGSTDCKHLINTASAMIIAENKIDIINACASVLRYKHNEQMYGALQKIGFPLERIDDFKERWDAIEKLISRAKNLVHTIASYQREMEKLQGTNHKPTEQDFFDSMTSMGKFQGYRIDPEITTVAEYLSIQRHYMRALEHAKQREHR